MKLIFWGIRKNPLEQCFFPLFICLFLNQTITFFASYFNFYASNEQLIFCFQNKNCYCLSNVHDSQDNRERGGYCRFPYAGTWELVNLFVGTKNFSNHICYENIGRKHNNILWSQETDTELSNMLVKRNILNKINKKGTFTHSFENVRKIKRKVS